jgi:beta-glucosidase
MDHTGDVADDQYHRFREDVRLMKDLGVSAYRFSISWSRVMPKGRGRSNPKGWDYYRRLADELLAQGIQPWATLFHWDLPQALETDFGGWASRRTAEAFGDYATEVARQLSDRVRHFFTINEFGCFTDMGYAQGIFAPGRRVSVLERNQIRHHAVLAHGLAVQALRAQAKGKLMVGLAENPSVGVPVIETPEHVEAARKAMRLMNAHFLTAVLEGRYPEEYLKSEGANAPVCTEGDMKIIASPLDFVGLNIYTANSVRAIDREPGFELIPHPESFPKMDTNWLYFCPQSLYWGVRLVSDLWKPRAVYITENGCASKDKLTADDEVLDTDRVMYLRNYLTSAQRASCEGYPLKGYFLWSLLDNFEWASGYTKRFGITYVNYSTLKRTPKLSYAYYREVIRSGAVL